MRRASLGKINRIVNSLGLALKHLLNLPWLVVGKFNAKASEAELIEIAKIERVVFQTGKGVSDDTAVVKAADEALMDGSFQGPIDDAVSALIDYIKRDNIIVLGIGERVHTLFPRSKLFVPYMLVPLFKLTGFNHLLLESLFADISSEEWDYVHNVIDKKFSPKDSINIKIKILRKIVEENPRILPKLNLNLQKMFDKDGLVGVIITARELGIHLYGIYTSDAIKLTRYERQLKIRNDGLAKALEIMNRIGKARSGKLMILCGDVHVACVPLKPTVESADTAAFIFGDVFLKDHSEYPYLNLTLLLGTKEDLLKEKDAIGKAGQLFYLRQYEDENFKIGDAKLFVVRDENQHRILLIFNTPVTGG